MEMKIQDKTCCFFGHRTIDETEEIKNNLYETIENLITKENVGTFFFGSKSQFDTLCHKTVTKLKEKHPHIKRIYVRSAFPDIDDSYENYLLKSYEESYFPEKMRGAGKASYVERNKEMIHLSKCCIIYYNENYLPPRRRNSKRDLLDYQPKSGTQIAYSYAKIKQKVIYNMF